MVSRIAWIMLSLNTRWFEFTRTSLNQVSAHSYTHILRRSSADHSLILYWLLVCGLNSRLLLSSSANTSSTTSTWATASFIMYWWNFINFPANKVYTSQKTTNHPNTKVFATDKPIMRATSRSCNPESFTTNFTDGDINLRQIKGARSMISIDPWSEAQFNAAIVILTGW